MNKKILKRINEADDFFIVRALEHFHDSIVGKLDTDVDDLLKSVPEELKDSIIDLDLEVLSEKAETKLEADVSTRLSRAVLSHFANIPAFETEVVDALDNWEDDRQLVGAMIGLGIAGSMLILTVSTEFKLKSDSGRVVVRKHKLSKAEIEAMSELAKSVFSPIANLISLFRKKDD